MYNGALKPVEDINSNDLLMGPDSQPRKVVSLSRGLGKMYKISPKKGDPFIVNEDHVLSLVKTNEGNKGNHKYSYGQTGDIINISVKEYLNKSTYFKHLHKLYRVPIDFKNNDPENLPIDPHFLGVLIGDGCLGVGTISVSTMDQEIADLCHIQAKRFGLNIRISNDGKSKASDYFFSNHKNNYGRNPLIQIIKNLGLRCGSEKKFIPHSYKFGSRKTRQAILAGLIDTDGYLSSNSIEYSTASKRLAYDLAFVARSLGFWAHPKPKIINNKTYWRFHIDGDFENLPLILERRKPQKRGQKKNVLRTGFRIEPVGFDEFFGFTLDKDGLYLLEDFTVTHNSGKTLCLSSVIDKTLSPNQRAVVIQHRDELTAQNVTKFSQIAPDRRTSIFDSNSKSWNGQVTFAMVQTLARKNNLATMPPPDVLVFDETHHIRAGSYMRIVDHAKELNENVRIYGVTATPERGDKKSLRAVFDNIGDQITVAELIRSGHLVPPKTYVIDVGTQEALRDVPRGVGDFDMDHVEKIMNRRVVNEAVIKKWREIAQGRKTVAYCSTIEHSKAVAQEFNENGIKAVHVDGEMDTHKRRAALQAYERGDADVITNVAVLTEGWDYPPTSCVMLLRPQSFKSTMVQMIGRGLRIIDPQVNPGVTKRDCVVLDFGISTLLHGTLEQDVKLRAEWSRETNPPMKECPDCQASVPLGTVECPFCGHQWTRAAPGSDDHDPLVEFEMTEVDILKRSDFKWIDLFGDENSFMASGFDAWTGIFSTGDIWHVVGGAEKRVRYLGSGEKNVALAVADDFLNANETDSGAHKSRQWLRQPATDRQLSFLDPGWRAGDILGNGLTRYHASCLLNFKFNKPYIQSLIMNANRGEAA